MDFREIYAKHIDGLLMQQMTNQRPQSDPDEPLTLEKLQSTIRSLDFGPPDRDNGRIIESEHLADKVMDFSRCRSPSRAKRRLAKGIRGRIQIIYVPWKHGYKLPTGEIVMHPITARAVRNHIDTFSESWSRPYDPQA